MEYIIKQFVPEEGREFLRSTIPPVITDELEAIEWAEYYGPGSAVYLRDEYYNEEFVHFVRFEE
jgi:hypothetical protein